jgi:hypothetical protein
MSENLNGTAVALAEATGGFGGFAQGGAGGGDGGHAMAEGTSMGGASADSTVDATGGDGGYVSEGGQGGRGGNASAVASSTATTQATSQANATGGRVGTVFNGGSIGRAGDAAATSSARATGAFGAASATSISRAGPNFGGSATSAGSAIASATASGATGTARADAMTRLSDNTRVQAVAVAPVTGAIAASTSRAEANAWAVQADHPVVPQDFLGGNQAYAAAVGAPGSAAYSSALAGDPHGSAIFESPGAEVMMYGAAGAAYAPDGSGSGTDKFVVNLAIRVDQQTFSSPEHFYLAFLDPVSTGDGFDQMTLNVRRGSSVLMAQSFATVAQAIAFFDDGTADLGFWTQTSDIQLALEFLISKPGDGFFVDVLAGTANSSIVPLPAAGWFFLTGMIAA